jgi:hypothetical protein
VHILSLLLVFPCVLGSVVMKRVTPSMFSSHCDKTTSPIEIGLMGCVFQYPSRLASVSVTFSSFRGGVVLSQVALWIDCKAKCRGRTCGSCSTGNLRGRCHCYRSVVYLSFTYHWGDLGHYTFFAAIIATSVTYAVVYSTNPSAIFV